MKLTSTRINLISGFSVVYVIVMGLSIIWFKAPIVYVTMLFVAIVSWVFAVTRGILRMIYEDQIDDNS